MMEIFPFTLIKTTDNNTIENKLKQYAFDNNYEFHVFGHKREDLDEVKTLYNSKYRVLCFIKNIDKSRVYDALLKLTEDNREDFVLVATYTMLNEDSPLVQRSRGYNYNSINCNELVKTTIVYVKNNNSLKSTILDNLWLSEKSIGVPITDYLNALANWYMKNITIVNSKNIKVINSVYNKYLINPNTLFIRAEIEKMLGELC